MQRKPKQKTSGSKAGKAAGTPRPRVGKAAGTPLPRVRTKWSAFRPMYDFWGQELKRYYRLETLQSAVDYMLEGRDRFLISSFQQVLGPAPIVSVHFELFQEGRFQFIFHVRAGTAKKRTGHFALVVAKNHQEASMVAQHEHRNLQLLHERAPQHVVRPYRGGKIFLPDRHGRQEMGREVYAYVTQWLQGFEELGVDRSLQFIVNIRERHVFSRAETEALKGKIVEIIARSYDAQQHNCMDMPEIASGDFVVRRGARGRHELRLIACRKLLTRIGPPSLIDRILRSKWKWGGREFTLAPEAPQTLVAALARARGQDEALQWLTQYAAAVGSRKLPRRNAGYFDALRELTLQSER